MTARALKVGYLLPTRDVLLTGEDPPRAEAVVTLAQHAEELGFDGVWVGDSLTAKPRLEPLSVLAAVAARTRRVRLGTAVLLGALRHPVLLAQTAATVDLLSGGRLTLGIGVGGAFTPEQRQEWRAAGVDQGRRASRLEEMIEILQRLWSGDRVSYNGKHFVLQEIALGFKSFRRAGIPILLACQAGKSREAQYRRAARLAEGMISITDSPEDFSRVRGTVLDEVQALGRNPRDFSAAYYLTVLLHPDREPARECAVAWITQYYGADYWGDRWGPYGPPEAVAARIREFAAAGADEIVVRFASSDQGGQLEVFAREVLPALKET